MNSTAAVNLIFYQYSPTRLRDEPLKSATVLTGGTLWAGDWFVGRGLADIAGRFDYAWLKGSARALAKKPYEPPNKDLPTPLARLDYDGHQSLRFRQSHSLWQSTSKKFRVQFFHRTSLFKERVRVHEIVNGYSRTIGYAASMFDFRKTGIESRSLPKNPDFAGFRVHVHTDWERDIASFLGASYFRAVGTDTRQYGLSARASPSTLHSIMARSFRFLVIFGSNSPPQMRGA